MSHVPESDPINNKIIIAGVVELILLETLFKILDHSTPFFIPIAQANPALSKRAS
jgi:hypothetical protein